MATLLKKTKIIKEEYTNLKSGTTYYYEENNKKHEVIFITKCDKKRKYKYCFLVKDKGKTVSEDFIKERLHIPDFDIHNFVKRCGLELNYIESSNTYYIKNHSILNFSSDKNFIVSTKHKVKNLLTR